MIVHCKLLRLFCTLCSFVLLTITCIHVPTITIDTILHKVNHEPLPLFEFARDVDQLMMTDLSISMIEIHVLHQSYLDALKDHYLAKFRIAMEDAGASEFKEIKRYILTEAEAAMKASKPKVDMNVSDQFVHVNHLLELENDLDSEIEGKYFTATSHHELSGLSQPSHENRGFILWKSRFWGLVRKKRVKWLVVKLVMISINYVQFELNRRISEYAAEKRLAEIPEFPLL